MDLYHSFQAQKAGIFLDAMGSYSTEIVTVYWYVMNLRGHTQRDIGTAWMIGFCGIIASFSFLSADVTFFHSGYSTCMGTM
jgi:hypothetical protein